MTAISLHNHTTVEEPFKYMDTIPQALFENLDFTFLIDFPVFAPRSGANTGSRTIGAAEGHVVLFQPGDLQPRRDRKRTS